MALAVRGRSASTRTPTSIDVRQTALTDARERERARPMWIGSRNVMRSMPAVTTRQRECLIAARPADLVAQLHHGAAVHEPGGVGVGRATSSGRAPRATRGDGRGSTGLGTLSPTRILTKGRCRGRHGRTDLHRHQGEDQQAARQGRGSRRDARVQLPEADGAAPERQEGHRRRRHVEEAPPAAAAEARAAGRQARHAGPPGARRRAARTSRASRSSASSSPRPSCSRSTSRSRSSRRSSSS